MKLLLDQNISYKVVKLLAGAFDDVKHVRSVGLVNVSDLENMAVCQNTRIHSDNFRQ